MTMPDLIPLPPPVTWPAAPRPAADLLTMWVDVEEELAARAEPPPPRVTARREVPTVRYSRD